MAWLAVARLLVTGAADALPRLAHRAATMDDALAALAALLGSGLLLWLALAFAATVLPLVLPAGCTARTAAQQVGRRIAPAGARRVLALTVAAAVVSSAAPARAATGSARPDTLVAVAAEARNDQPAPDRRSSAAASHTADGLGLDPSWAPAATPPRPLHDDPLDPSWGGPARRRPGTLTDDLVVVRRGDTLWDLAARRLGPGATDAEIARAWPLWFATNRSVIGPDPDRLTPGQRLRPPDPVSGGTP